ncbi:MAG TPA: rhomboid-like protein [Streptosporangiaceae bacterium]
MLRRYAFTWCYLGLYVVAGIVYANLGAHGQDVLATWTSTSVVNLEHDPVGTLIASAIVGQGNYIAWPVLIALALFPANHALGNAKIALICLAGNVIGSLISEGIIAYRVDTGQLPVAYRHLIDVGPSYVVVAAVVAALISGGWVARISAGFVLGVLVFIGNIFGGLSTLDVSAVGHLTSGLTAFACLAPALYRRFRPAAGRDFRVQRAPATEAD